MMDSMGGDFAWGFGRDGNGVDGVWQGRVVFTNKV